MMDTLTSEALSGPAEACLVAEHALAFLLDFSCVRDEHLPRIDALTTGRIDPDGVLGILHPAQREGSNGRVLFEPGKLDLSADLHPAVRAALADEGSEPSDVLSCRTLTQFGRRLLNGELARPPGDPRQHPGFVPGRGLALPLGRESRARIEAAGGADQPFLRVVVEALHLVTFGSETGMALLWLTVTPNGPVRLAHIEHALHILSNTSRSHTLGWACEAEPAGRFSLMGLVQGLLAPAGCAGTPWTRLFTYSYAQLQGSPGDATLDIAAWRISRHYTDAYRPGADYLAGTALSRPFSDIVHAASMEGIASVTVPETTFLREAFAARMRTCYLPLAVLAFHEHVQLLTMAQRAAAALSPTAQAGDGKRAEALRKLVDGFLSFRLRYRLAIVSDITMHNAFYAAVRAGLEVEALTRKLAGDTADAARSLQDGNVRAAAERSRKLHKAHLKRERGRSWILGLFAGLLTFLTSLAVLKEVRGLLPDGMHGPEWWPAAGAAALALLSGVVTTQRNRDAHAASSEEDAVGTELLADLQGEAAHVAGEASSPLPLTEGRTTLMAVAAQEKR